jgi:hypothetical protein
LELVNSHLVVITLLVEAAVVVQMEELLKVVPLESVAVELVQETLLLDLVLPTQAVAVVEQAALVEHLVLAVQALSLFGMRTKGE